MANTTFQKLVIDITIIKLIGILSKNDREGMCEQSYLLHWLLFPVTLIKYSLVLIRFIRIAFWAKPNEKLLL